MVSENSISSALTPSPLIWICGPTGVGKTEISISIAEKLNGEIIVADSQATIIGFDIGTAKPTAADQKRIPHHLIDIRRWGEKFDVAIFARLAQLKISEIQKKGKTPIISGGSGLYFKAVLYGLMDAPSRSEELRKEFEEQIDKIGLQALYKKLVEIDPERAKQIHPNDRFRIIRGLEIYELSGKKPSDLMRNHQFDSKQYSALKIGLFRTTEDLNFRINERVLKMIEQGWIEETRKLMKEGIQFLTQESYPIGYTIIADYIRGALSLKDAILEIQKKTRHLAKQQRTWLKKDTEIIEIHASDLSKIEDLIGRHLC